MTQPLPQEQQASPNPGAEIEPPQEVVSDVAVETSQEAAPTANEVEELAREMGWSPETEWRGPKESWKSAKDYIRHGTVIQRDLKARNDAAQREFQARLDRMDRTNQIALSNQRKQLDDAWKARMREAVAIGDTDAFDRASHARETALNKFDEEVGKPESPQSAPKQEHAPEIKAFAARNPWFDVNPIMTDVAVGISQGLERRYPNMPLGERLNAMEQEVKRRFPEEFGQSHHNGNGRTTPPHVEGGLRPIKTEVKKGWESLPNEAKAAGAKFVKDGIFKTKEDYANKYWAQE